MKNLKNDPEKLEKEVVNDIEKIFNFVNSLDNLDIDNLNLDKLEESVDILKKSMSKKYKDIIPKKYLDFKK